MFRDEEEALVAERKMLGEASEANRHERGRIERLLEEVEAKRVLEGSLGRLNDLIFCRER